MLHGLVSSFVFKENNFEPLKEQLQLALSKYMFFQSPGETEEAPPTYEKLLKQLWWIEYNCHQVKEHGLCNLYAGFEWWRDGRNLGEVMKGKPDYFKKMVAAFILQYVLEKVRRESDSEYFSCDSLGLSLKEYMEQTDHEGNDLEYQCLADNYQQTLDTAKEFEGQHFGDIFTYVTGAEYLFCAHILKEEFHPVVEDLIKRGEPYEN